MQCIIIYIYTKNCYKRHATIKLVCVRYTAQFYLLDLSSIENTRKEIKHKPGLWYSPTD